MVEEPKKNGGHKPDKPLHEEAMNVDEKQEHERQKQILARRIKRLLKGSELDAALREYIKRYGPPQ